MVSVGIKSCNASRLGFGSLADYPGTNWASIGTSASQLREGEQRLGRLWLQSLYLEMDKAALLDDLAAQTRIPKAVLLREAVDDLLIKYKKLKVPKRRP